MKRKKSPRRLCVILSAIYELDFAKRNFGLRKRQQNSVCLYICQIKRNEMNLEKIHLGLGVWLCITCRRGSKLSWWKGSGKFLLFKLQLPSLHLAEVSVYSVTKQWWCITSHLSSPRDAWASAGCLSKARAFNELGRYHTRPSWFNWGPKMRSKGARAKLELLMN